MRKWGEDLEVLEGVTPARLFAAHGGVLGEGLDFKWPHVFKT